MSNARRALSSGAAPRRSPALLLALGLLPLAAAGPSSAGGLAYTPRVFTSEEIAGRGAPSAAATNRWDAWHDDLSSNLVDSVVWFDRFFDDERQKYENRGTRVSVGAGLTYDADDGLSFENDFSARVELPALERRLQLIVDNLARADEAGDVDNIVDAYRSPEPDTGLRYLLKDVEAVRISADAGLRFSSPVQVFGKLRGRRNFDFRPWELQLSQIVQWFSVDGFGTISEMRWDRKIGAGWLFESATDLEWEEASPGVTPTQGFGFYRSLSRRRAHKINLYGTWPETPHTHEANYVIQYSYRQLIHRDWLFIEITPGLKFPQADDYQPDPYITVMFDVVFGDTR